MTLIIRSVTNSTPYTLTLKVPSLEEHLSPVAAASNATLQFRYTPSRIVKWYFLGNTWLKFKNI